MYQNIFVSKKDNTIYLWDDKQGLVTYKTNHTHTESLRTNVSQYVWYKKRIKYRYEDEEESMCRLKH